MGLQLTLNKENNRQYTDYVDAYWSIDDISYTTQIVRFRLRCYPSRESKYKDLHQMPTPTLPVGSASPDIYSTVLYQWETYVMITEVFKSGIPLSEDEQKTALYEWVKANVDLPFVDVFE